MKKPVHFDRAEVEAMLAKSLADSKAMIMADAKLTAQQKTLSCLMYDIDITFTRDFILAAKECGLGHEDVAQSVGHLMAQILLTTMENYTCNCVGRRALEAFNLNLQLAVSGGLQKAGAGRVEGASGGRA